MPKPDYQGTVRISVPASVAYDLGKFQKSLAVLAERLGCKPCFSGADCFFQHERDWVIDEKLKVSANLVNLRGTVPDVGPSVKASLPMSVSGNLATLQKAVAAIAGRLGCTPCTSGFDLFFQQEIEHTRSLQVRVNEKGAIEAAG